MHFPTTMKLDPQGKHAFIASVNDASAECHGGVNQALKSKIHNPPIKVDVPYQNAALFPSL